MQQLYGFKTKAQRKICQLFKQLIPYNTSFKPTGYYGSLSDYVLASKATCIEVIPPKLSVLNVEQQLIDGAQKIFNIPKTDVQAAASLTIVKQGRLYTDSVSTLAVISNDNKVIGNISLQIGTLCAAENGVFKTNFFSTPLKLNGNVFHTLIGGGGENNYFHWLIDSIPRIHLLEKSGWLDKIDWFIVPRNNLPFQKDTLRLLGIDASKIIEGHINQHIEAENLFATTFIRNLEHIPKWVCRFLRDKFLPIAQKPFDAPEYIYVSRRDSGSRNVDNEDEVLAMLSNYGFRKVVLSNYTFAEQVALFKHAKAIVAMHGAGLTNLVFCERGTKVIELFAEEYTPTLYADLANKVDLDYNYIINPGSSNKTLGLNRALAKNVIVAVDKLEKLIQGKLEQELYRN